MSFQASVLQARSNAADAVRALSRYNPSAGVDDPYNRIALANARESISPRATHAGADALDAARWERQVSRRQIQDLGRALELLDSAWWDITPRGGRAPDVDSARSDVRSAVELLDRSARWSPMDGRWSSQPLRHQVA